MTNNTPPEHTDDEPFLLLSPVWYDRMRFLVQVVLPALVSLIITLGLLYSWAGSEVVAGTISAITLFLGLILGKSRRNYNQTESRFSGAIDVTQDEEGTPIFDFKLSSQDIIAALNDKQEVVLKVGTPES